MSPRAVTKSAAAARGTHAAEDSFALIFPSKTQAHPQGSGQQARAVAGSGLYDLGTARTWAVGTEVGASGSSTLGRAPASGQQLGLSPFMWRPASLGTQHIPGRKRPAVPWVYSTL